MLKKILFIFIIWRIFLFLPLWAGRNIPYRIKYEYTHIFTSTLKYAPVDRPLLYPLANFDGVHYLDIAGNSYKDNGRFFPLYPILIRGLATIFGTGQAFGIIQFFSALAISQLSFLLAIIFLYKLLRLDFSEKISFWSIIFLMTFPTSFFFGLIYTESLFLLFLVLSLYLARKQKWFWSSFFAMLLTITRPIGIVLIPALIYEAYKQKKFLHFNLSFYFLIFDFLIIIPLGLFLFSYYCLIKWHDPLFFLHAQALLQNGRSVTGFIFPLQTVWRYLKIITTVSPNIFEWKVALLEIFSFGFGSGILVFAWFKKIRPSFLIFSLFALLIPTLSGTFSGLPRYLLVIFPIFLTLNFIKAKWFKPVYIIFGLILQFVLFLFFSRGYFIA